jgi:adenylosuccinate lyase
MRAHRVPGSYEKLKELTRGKGGISQADLQEFIKGLPLPEDVRARLAALTPSTYIGLASRLARGK